MIWLQTALCCLRKGSLKMLNLRARCPSILNLNSNFPRDDFAIELTFVTLGHGFKKAGSVLFDICAPGTRITSLDICITGWCYGCVSSCPRVCSKYSNWYYLLLI